MDPAGPWVTHCPFPLGLFSCRLRIYPGRRYPRRHEWPSGADSGVSPAGNAAGAPGLCGLEVQRDPGSIPAQPLGHDYEGRAGLWENPMVWGHVCVSA